MLTYLKVVNTMGNALKNTTKNGENKNWFVTKIAMKLCGFQTLSKRKIKRQFFVSFANISFCYRQRLVLWL